MCTHTQRNPFFYHPFYPDVTHVRKDIKISPTYLYWEAVLPFGVKVLMTNFLLYKKHVLQETAVKYN